MTKRRAFTSIPWSVSTPVSTIARPKGTMEVSPGVARIGGPEGKD